ncbi:MAG: hypothetical protein ABSE22_21205 [Xanthobacteraceae bacterium]|jgi:hypothetical protein
MDHSQSGFDQIDEEVFYREISDAALEAASGFCTGEIVTLMYGSYCFTCVLEDGTAS